MKKPKVAIVGTQGVPNSYGGFETLAEFLVLHLADQFALTIYCSSTDQQSSRREFGGAKLANFPISSHGGLGMIYDSLTLVHACFTHDAVLFLGFGAGLVAPFVPALRRKMILNFGGLDWKRKKWSSRAKHVIRLCEQQLVRNCRVVVADNELIADYVRETYGREPVSIAYGGDQATIRPATLALRETYPFLAGRYALSVARIQPDNNIDMILEWFPVDAGYPLVVIGNWKGSDYGKRVRAKYSGRAHLILLDGIYDRSVLDVIRSNCAVYIHAHSAGGTNPSLCEAMILGLPIVAFASGYNERTMGGMGWFFRDGAELAQVVKAMGNRQAVEAISKAMQAHARAVYTWSSVAALYADCFRQAIERS